MKLVLKSEVGNWERFVQRKEHEKFKQIRADILYRDAFTCQFCAQVSQALEVINADNNYRHNVPTNMVSACELCARVNLLDSYAMDYAGQDRIIYFPELLQEQMNQLCRMLFCKMTMEGESTYNAKRIFAQLQDRAAWLNQKANCQLSHPGMFNVYFRQQQKDPQLIQQLRWLPHFDSYQESVPRWKDEITSMVEAAESADAE